MRILSQDGRTDFPYERVCLEVSDSGKIFVQGDIWGAEDNYIEVAIYENEEKARKAMEMLRGKYSTLRMQEVIDRDINQAVYERIENNDKEKFFSAFFQFPDDDEVEV